MRGHETSVLYRSAPHVVPPITRQVVNIAPTMEQRNVPVHLPALPMPHTDVMQAQGNVVVERSVKIGVNPVEGQKPVIATKCLWIVRSALARDIVIDSRPVPNPGARL